jgi:toxin CcdB
MAQFDVFRLADGALVVDCQADLLNRLNSRFVVPLLPPHLVEATNRLNPSFAIEGETMHFVPQGAATVPAKELRLIVTSLAEQQFVIMNAVDFLLTGA